jgi:hypothetical protein
MNAKAKGQKIKEVFAKIVGTKYPFDNYPVDA